jgi:hypothetical protein
MNETPINSKIHWSQCVIHYSNKCVWYKIMPRSESTSFTIIINMAFRMKPLSIKINKLVFILRGLLLWIPVFWIILFFQKIDLLKANKLLIFLKISSDIKNCFNSEWLSKILLSKEASIYLNEINSSITVSRFYSNFSILNFIKDLNGGWINETHDIVINKLLIRLINF